MTHLPVLAALAAADDRVESVVAHLAAGVSVHAVADAPVGGYAYGIGVKETADLWASALMIWPEFVLVAVLLTAAAAIARALRRKYVAGEWQCRRCDYVLRGLTSDRCPECGLELTARNRRFGAWPTARVATGLAIIAGVSATYWLTYRQVPCVGVVSDMVRLPSGWWAQWQSDHPDLLPHSARKAERRRVLLKVDSETGEWTVLADDIPESADRLVVHDDGKSVFLWGAYSNELERRSTHDGRVLWKLSVEGIAPYENLAAPVEYTNPRDVWFPKGGRLIAGRHSFGGIWAVDVKTGAQVQRVDDLIPSARKAPARVRKAAAGRQVVIDPPSSE